MAKFRIFFWGQVAPGTTALARRDALVDLGCDVVTGSNWEIVRNAGRLAFHAARRFGLGPLIQRENEALLASVQERFDLIWIEKGIFIRPETLMALRNRTGSLVHFTPDPAFNFHTETKHFLSSLSHYDLCGTTKPNEVAEYLSRGAKRVILLSKSYCPTLHRTYPEDELAPFKADIVFSGTWTAEKERCLSHVQTAFPNRVLKIWGGEWRRKAKNRALLQVHQGDPRGTFGADYGRSISGAKIALGLLSTDVYGPEVITDRIMEIPACGSLLVAPRTDAIEALFTDGIEALLYSTESEMLEKIEWALEHEPARLEIVERGRDRILKGPFRDQDVVAQLIREALGATKSIRSEVSP